MKTIKGNPSAVLSFFWGCFGLLFLRTSEGEKSVQYCPYFENRGPSKQANLRNCTWYKDNSCCHDEEIAFAFQQLTPLVGANENCLHHLNYLYCYICAPHQNVFFKDYTLTVCEEFCNDIYSACKDALLKGRKIQDIYSDGKQFCQSRRFKTDQKNNKRCFAFEGAQGTRGKSQRIVFDAIFLALGGLFTAFVNNYILV